jgi:hypothetical protein
MGGAFFLEVNTMATTQNCSELAGRVDDVLARRLDPQRALLVLRRHLNGVDADDLHLAMLTLLTEQRELIAHGEREVLIHTRHIDRLESEISDLHDELEALRASLRELRHWRDDNDDEGTSP